MGYEDIEAPIGTFISWGSRPKQHVTGRIIDYDETGGNDFGNNPCPLLEIELTEKAASINKEGERTDYEPGETVMLTCGQANLKRKIKRADLKRGDLVKIMLTGSTKVSNGTLKEFSVQVDRSAAAASVKADGGGSGGDFGAADDDEPPF